MLQKICDALRDLVPDHTCIRIRVAWKKCPLENEKCAFFPWQWKKCVLLSLRKCCFFSKTWPGYYLYILKNVKENHEGLLYNFIKNNTPPWVFFTFLKLYKCFQIAKNVSYVTLFGKNQKTLRRALSALLRGFKLPTRVFGAELNSSHPAQFKKLS